MREDTRNPNEPDRQEPELSGDALDREVLIGRVVEGEASPEDWDALRAIAETDGTVWADLSQTQRQHELLCASVSRVCALADGVELDGALVDPEPMVRRLRLVGSWGGWAMAAGLGLMWALGINPLVSSTGGPVAGPVAGQGVELAPDDALAQYLSKGREAGRVIREVPDRVVVRAEPIDDGRRVEVFYLRQILEREVVDQVYREAVDDLGNRLTIPVRLEPDTGGGSVW